MLTEPCLLVAVKSFEKGKTREGEVVTSKKVIWASAGHMWRGRYTTCWF